MSDNGTVIGTNAIPAAGTGAPVVVERRFGVDNPEPMREWLEQNRRWDQAQTPVPADGARPIRASKGRGRTARAEGGRIMLELANTKLTVKQTAALLGMSETHVYNMARDGRIKAERAKAANGSGWKGGSRYGYSFRIGLKDALLALAAQEKAAHPAIERERIRQNLTNLYAIRIHANIETRDGGKGRRAASKCFSVFVPKQGDPTKIAEKTLAAIRKAIGDGKGLAV